jgi:hypothetical protein
MNLEFIILSILIVIFVCTAGMGLLDLWGIRKVDNPRTKKFLRNFVIAQACVVFIGVAKVTVLPEKSVVQYIEEITSLLETEDEAAWTIMAQVVLENGDNMPIDVAISPSTVETKQDGRVEVDLVIKRDKKTWAFPNMLVSAPGYAARTIYFDLDKWKGVGNVTNEFDIKISEADREIKIMTPIELDAVEAIRLDEFEPEYVGSEATLFDDSVLIEEYDHVPEPPEVGSPAEEETQ